MERIRAGIQYWSPYRATTEGSKKGGRSRGRMFFSIPCHEGGKMLVYSIHVEKESTSWSLKRGKISK